MHLAHIQSSPGPVPTRIAPDRRLVTAGEAVSGPRIVIRPPSLLLRQGRRRRRLRTAQITIDHATGAFLTNQMQRAYERYHIAASSVAGSGR
jgi:hypothetical protein